MNNKRCNILLIVSLILGSFFALTSFGLIIKVAQDHYKESRTESRIKAVDKNEKDNIATPELRNISKDENRSDTSNNNDENSNSDSDLSLNTNNPIWKSLIMQRKNGCEGNQNETSKDVIVFNLKKYPEIKLPKQDRFLIVSSLRNFIASDSALDMINENGDIVYTIYNLGPYAISEEKDVFFEGKYDKTCNNDTSLLGMLNPNTSTYIVLDDSPFNYDSELALTWSKLESYVVASQLYDKNNRNKYLVVIFDATDGHKYRKVILEGPNFERSCGSVNCGPDVYFDEESKTLSFDLKDESTPTREGKIMHYTYSLDGKFIDKVESEVQNEATTENCEMVEYTDGGTSTFCQY